MSETAIPSREWMKIAADMIDARSFKIDRNSSEDEKHAFSFLFDEGVFFAGDEGMLEIKEMLLAKHAGIEP